jgi:plasmid stabilization system protein ParE
MPRSIRAVEDIGPARCVSLIIPLTEDIVPQGDKTAYTDKQKRKVEHIEQGYEQRGVPKKTAEARAWATVNKDDGGGKNSGAGRGKSTGHPAATRGGKAHKAGSPEQRSAAARKGWETRRKNAGK